MRFQQNVDVLLNKRLALKLLFAEPAFTSYDDDPVDPEDELEPDPPADPNVTPPIVKDKKLKKKVVFSDEQQEYVNSILAEDRRKSKSATDKIITQLETLKNQHGTTAAEKETLEARIEDLKNTQLTADEMRKKEEIKKTKKHTDELAVANEKAAKWEKMFYTSTITRSITDAAVVEKAHNPKHIVNELAPNTRLVEDLDEENKPLGTFTPKVKMTTVKDGKPTTLEFTVTEAVKFMKEQDEHAPLFNSGATGGIGGNPNNPKKRGVDSDTPPTDPAEYAVWRKKNRGKVGGIVRGVAAK